MNTVFLNQLGTISLLCNIVYLHMWPEQYISLECPYYQGRNRDADEENRHVDTAGEGEGGMNI